MHGLTNSQIVVLVNDGKVISSTASQESEVVKNLAAAARWDKENPVPYIEPDFGNNLVAGFIPILFSGTETSLIVAIAVAGDTIRYSYSIAFISLH